MPYSTISIGSPRILEQLFDANTVLAANADDTPAPITVAEDCLVGRMTAGNIASLSKANVRTILDLTNVEDTALSTWAGTANITTVAESAVTSHQAALAVTESQISNLGTTVAMVADNLSVFAATTSAQLAGVMSDETGSGFLVFATSPTLITPALGTPSALVLTNATGLPEAQVTAHQAAISITESQVSDLQGYLLPADVDDVPVDAATAVPVSSNWAYDHAANVSNPHSVTKTQVGLGSVENTALSTWAGTSSVTTIGETAVTAHQAALTIASSQISDKGGANGLATLGADSKIPTSQLPALAITDTSVVVSEVAMLALTAETGDVAVRSDENKSYILAGTDPTILAHWQELLTPTDTVLSVNGYTGAVTLVKADVGLTNVEDTALSTWAGTSNITTVAQGAVTAHEAALSILTAQITDLSTSALDEEVAQTAHGFVVGDVIRSSGTNGEYTKAQADSAVNAEVIGIVTEVVDANNFVYNFGGAIDTAAAVPNEIAGTVLFLDPATPGTLVTTQTSSTGEVIKALAIVTAQNSKMIWINATGVVVADAVDSPVSAAELAAWAGTANVVTVGALNAGSITSGFGNIDIGASTFDTTGAVGTGQLTVTGGQVFIGDTANSEITGYGLTINSGVDNNEVIALKGSSISHSFTATEEDTYGTLRHQNSSNGGIRLSGFTDTDAGAIGLVGYVGTSGAITAAGVSFNARKSDGAGGTAEFAAGEVAHRFTTDGTVLLDIYGDGAANFQSGTITTTGTAATGALTVTGAATVSSAVTAPTFYAHAAGTNVAAGEVIGTYAFWTDDQSTGSGQGQHGKIDLYADDGEWTAVASTHDAAMRFYTVKDSNDVLALEISSSQNFDFQAGNLTTIGTAATGSLTVTGTLTQTGNHTIGDGSASSITWWKGSATDYIYGVMSNNATNDGWQFGVDNSAGSLTGTARSYYWYNYLGASTDMHLDTSGNLTLTGGNLDVTGTITATGAGTFDYVDTGGTLIFSANGTAAAGRIWREAADGLVLGGIAGSANDFEIRAASGVAILSNPTGTSSLLMGGNLTVTGTADFSDNVSVTQPGAGYTDLGVIADSALALIGGGAANDYNQIAFGYTPSGPAPAAFGYQTTDGTSFTRGDFVWALRNVTTSTAPTELMRLTSSGTLTLTGATQALSLKGGAADHVYMGWYADAAAQSTRSAYIGFSGTGTDLFTIKNEQGSTVEVYNGMIIRGNTTVVGQVTADNKVLLAPVGSPSDFAGMYATAAGNDDVSLHFGHDYSSGSWVTQLTIDNAGNLTSIGTAEATSFQVDAYTGTKFTFSSGFSSSSYLSQESDLDAYHLKYYAGRNGSANLGSHSFWTGDGAGTPTNRLTIRSSGKIGIGTDSPSYLLHMEGGNILLRSPSSENRMFVSGGEGDGDDAILYLYSNTASSKVSLHTNGDSYLNGGNVGIGASTPAAKLDVRTDTEDDGIWLRKIDGTDVARLHIEGSSGRLRLYSGGALKATIQTDGGDSYITNSNLGIGTTTPGSELDVRGQIRGSHATSGETIYMYAAAVASDPGILGTSIGSGLGFETNGGTRRMTIESAGNVGIGTGAPGGRLHVLNGAGSTDPSNYLIVEGSTVNNTNFPGIRFKGGTGPDATTHAYIGTNNTGVGLTINTGYDAVSYTKYQGLFMYNGGSGLTSAYTRFQTAGVETFKVLGNGQTGITSPAETQGLFYIKGGEGNEAEAGKIHGAIEFRANDPSVNNTNNVAGKIVSVSENSNGAYGGLGFYTFSQGRSPDLKEAVRIDYRGYMGIQTSAPTQALHVVGNAYVTGTFESDGAALIGAAKIGDSTAHGGNYSDFSHTTRFGSATDYSFLSFSSGDTYVNAKSGYKTYFRVNNVDVATVSATSVNVVNSLYVGRTPVWTPESSIQTSKVYLSDTAYSGITQASGEVRIEAPRTNLFSSGNQCGNFGAGTNVGSWVGGGTDLGFATMMKFTGSLATYGNRYSTGITMAQGTYTFSTFWKKGTSTFVPYIKVGSGGIANGPTVYIDMDNEAIGAGGTAVGATTSGIKLEDRGVEPTGIAGVFRVWMTMTADWSSSYFFPVIYPSNNSGYHEVAGAQMEAGWEATSYISTGTVRPGIITDGLTSTGGAIRLENTIGTPAAVADTAVLYEVSGELYVKDSANNATLLSPHRFDLIPDGPSEVSSWAYYSENDEEVINVDMLKLARLVEDMSGEQLVHIKKKMAA